MMPGEKKNQNNHLIVRAAKIINSTDSQLRLVHNCSHTRDHDDDDFSYSPETEEKNVGD